MKASRAVMLAAAVIGAVVARPTPPPAGGGPGRQLMDSRLVGATAPGGTVVGFAALPAGGGHRTAHADGRVGSYGAAQDHGSMAGRPMNGSVVGIATSASGDGYWLVGSDGGIFSFGDAAFHGSMGGTRLNRPVVGMAATTTGSGYWLFADDGGVFAFGDAPFLGSTGSLVLQRPVVAMTAHDAGYWLVGSDGGVFAFGAALYAGSMGGASLAAPVVGILRTPSGRGYWLAGRDGGVFSFGDGRFHGATADLRPPPEVLGLTPRAGGADGYVIVTAHGATHEMGPGVAPPTTATPTTSAATTTTTGPPVASGEGAIRDALHRWLNDERAARGLPVLRLDDRLVAKADEWVRDPRFRAEGHEPPDEWAASPHTAAFLVYGEGSSVQPPGAAAGAGGAHAGLFGSSRHRPLYLASSARPDSVVVGLGVRCHADGLDVVLDVAQLRQDRPGEPNGGNDLAFPEGPAEPQVHRDVLEGPRC